MVLNGYGAEMLIHGCMGMSGEVLEREDLELWALMRRNVRNVRICPCI